MAPGFALMLSIVMAAAIAPVIAATGMALLFFNRTQPYAKAIFTAGTLASGVVMAAFLLVGLFHSRLPSQENYILCAASFSIAAMVAVMFRLAKERRDGHRDGF